MSEENETKNTEPNQDIATETVHENTLKDEPSQKTQPPIIDNKLPTENMEIHHPHHVTHKKKWEEYLLEFFMLFLAVFLGFVAENIRERQVENNKEIEFIHSLTADLNDDIHNLDIMIGFEQNGIKQLDTLLDLLDDPALAKQKGDELYYVARQGPREQPFPVNSRTLEQLKSSGGFLLIRNVDASNQVINYYNHFSQVKLMEENYNSEFDNYKRIAAKVFNPAILRRQEAAAGDILRSQDNPLLLTYDDNQLKELGFHVLQMGGSRRSRMIMLLAQKITAEKLKSYLQKEYHFEKE